MKFMLPNRYDRSIEKKWQKYWIENNIYTFAELELERGNSKFEASIPIYSIDTPPPFTNGELHMGHVLSYAFFDFVARYKRMRGYNVYYPQGWDTQGFPTEVRVENKFGTLPLVKFRQKCVEWTYEFIARMKQQMIELGFSPDWRYEYRTMDSEYHAKVQKSLIEMYNKKLIYRAEYPVYWCPKCVSAIAKAELDDVEKQGIIYNIIFRDKNNKKLVIATTRPELLPACVALLYHSQDERYAYLKNAEKAITPLGKEIPIFADSDVDKEFGSGLVMVCTFGDKMDVVWAHRYKLAFVNCIDQYGKMINAGELNGLKVSDAKKKIVEKLKSEGKVLKEQQLPQIVKVHDRCNTVVELISSMQWFADIRTHAKAIKEMAHKIKWVPDFGITYLIDWIEGAEWDWVISRQRIFGTPIPFYYCEKCGATAPSDVLPFYPEKAEPKKCNCGERMKPETSICDCWVDSSITPLIISGWPDNKKMFEKLYPSSLRPQGVEIVRTWAFYTIYRSGVGLTGIPPWETILLNGKVLAPDGKKMSKSLGNVISPTELLKEYSADAIRQWAAMSGAMAKDRPFSYEDIKYAKSFITKLWNAARFIEDIDTEKQFGITTSEIKKKPPLFMKVDKWMLNKLNNLVEEVTDAYERFEFHSVMNLIHQFFWHDFCDDYLEFTKYRIYSTVDDLNDDYTKSGAIAAYYTLKEILTTCLFLLAPITPHVTEEIYSSFNEHKNKSIHNSALWPARVHKFDDEFSDIEAMREIIHQLRRYKAKNKSSQATEIGCVEITSNVKLNEEIVKEIKRISKVKEIRVKKGENLVVEVK